MRDMVLNVCAPIASNMVELGKVIRKWSLIWRLKNSLS